MAILEYETNNEPIISFTLANRGVGPAIIRRATVKVDGQPVTNWRDALQKLLGPGDHFYSDSTMVGRVLSPGESIDILIPDGLDGKRLAVGTSGLADLMNKARFGCPSKFATVHPWGRTGRCVMTGEPETSSQRFPPVPARQPTIFKNSESSQPDQARQR